MISDKLAVYGWARTIQTKEFIYEELKVFVIFINQLFVMLFRPRHGGYGHGRH